MKNHSGGSHNAQAIPDAKMGHSQYRQSGVKQTDKRIARKKRRQHGSKVIREEG